MALHRRAGHRGVGRQVEDQASRPCVGGRAAAAGRPSAGEADPEPAGKVGDEPRPLKSGPGGTGGGGAVSGAGCGGRFSSGRSGRERGRRSRRPVGRASPCPAPSVTVSEPVPAPSWGPRAGGQHRSAAVTASGGRGGRWWSQPPARRSPGGRPVRTGVAAPPTTPASDEGCRRWPAAVAGPDQRGPDRRPRRRRRPGRSSGICANTADHARPVHHSAPSEMPMNARTRTGSKCVPAAATSSLRAAPATSGPCRPGWRSSPRRRRRWPGSGPRGRCPRRPAPGDNRCRPTARGGGPRRRPRDRARSPAVRPDGRPPRGGAGGSPTPPRRAGPGLFRMSPGTASLPMSWRSAPHRSLSRSSSESPASLASRSASVRTRSEWPRVRRSCAPRAATSTSAASDAS